jgi:hypothetical protein
VAGKWVIPGEVLSLGKTIGQNIQLLVQKVQEGKKGLPAGRNNEVAETFIPMKVSGDRTANVSDGEYGRIEVSFLNGVQLSCPVGIDIGQLKSLINF